MATELMTNPPFDFPAAENNNPKIAKGILSQLNHPKNGKKPNNMPKSEAIPNKRPKNFIITLFFKFNCDFNFGS